MEIPSAEQSINQLVDNIHTIAAGHAPLGTQIGIVIAPLPDIQIAWNNIILTKKELYIDATLLIGYERFSQGDVSLPNAKGHSDMDNATGDIRTKTIPRRGGHKDPSFISHNHKINDSYKADIAGDYEADIASDYASNVIYTDYGLNVGDQVMLTPIMNGQMFIITGRIIYLRDWTQPELKEVRNGKAV